MATVFISSDLKLSSFDLLTPLLALSLRTRVRLAIPGELSLGLPAAGFNPLCLVLLGEQPEDLVTDFPLFEVGASLGPTEFALGFLAGSTTLVAESAFIPL